MERQLRGFPHEFQALLMAIYHRQATRRERNISLRLNVKAITEKLGCPARNVLFDYSDLNIRTSAKQHARFCDSLSKTASVRETLALELRQYAQRQSIKLNTALSPKAVIARMRCQDWWQKRLKWVIRHNREMVYHHCNRVNRKSGIYCSNWLAATMRNERIQTHQWLEQTVLVNELDQAFSLKELSALNVSNPKIRHAELMVRARGFEEFADEADDIGLFITVSCPSRFHRAYSKTGDTNPKWDDSTTPKAGQSYLRDVWAKTRAAWHRQQIAPYGFRIAEPQHDGTPHWHLLLFVPKAHSKALVQTFRHYALLLDGDEPGAAEHRFDVKVIDKEKGSATGYIAKYICKNIDGEHLDSGIYGEDPIEAAERVRAWASSWGIRQFQQIGGASVTVWRELRRVKAHLMAKGSALLEVWHAADNGNWCAYLKAMKGLPAKGDSEAKANSNGTNNSPISAKAKKSALAPLYDLQIDSETGEARTHRYDGTITYALKGLLFMGQKLITRHHEWRRVDASALSSASLGVL
ncbi:replication endonuclease [Halomonas denitrificans]|nr:replication endonuclease [Halomonas denitrificans]